MIPVIPQILSAISRATGAATEPMRGWMESVTRAASATTVELSADTTTSGNTRAVVVNPITITLRPDAVEDEWVTVIHKTVDNVTITDGFGSVVLTTPKTTATFRFVINEGWELGA